VKGALGDLTLSPKLVPAQFDAAGCASVSTLFAGRTLKAIYHNPAKLDPAQYHIAALQLDGAAVAFEHDADAAVIARGALETLDAAHSHTLEVFLKVKS